MIYRLFLVVSCLTILIGCATSGRKYELELQQCQQRVISLNQELKDKERELASLRYTLENSEKESFPRTTTAPVKKSPAPKVYPSQRDDMDTRPAEKSYSSVPSTNQIQRALKNAGYYNGPVDGKIGVKTQEAIIRFQKDNGLKADGKVGQKTWSELKEHLE
ncbi:MAG: peptidoglycan-binding protein [Candidatus Omnitrophota bacterium]